MSLHLIMVIGFLSHSGVDYFQIHTGEALMCLQDWLWTNMEGN